MKKILLLLFIFFSSYIYAFDKNYITPSEGKYNKNIIIESKDITNDLLFYFENSDAKKPIPFPKSGKTVILSAAEGEEKKYSITFTKKDSTEKLFTLNYTIDRKLPEKPEIIISENFLSFAKTDNSVYYRINRDNWKIWNNDNIDLYKINTLYYYNQDSSGNKSIISTWSNQDFDNYRITDNRLKIFSPEKGSFYNKQFLLIDTNDFEWIKYSFKNSESSINGQNYTKPFLINKTGSINIFIAAKPYNSDNIVFSDISFNVSENLNNIKTEILENNDESFITAVSSKIVLYSLNNNDSFTRYETPVKLATEKDSINLNTVYFKTFDDKTEFKYRYFYLFDNRKTIEDKINIKKSKKEKNPDKPVLAGIKKLKNGGKQIFLNQKKNISYIYTINEKTAPDNPVSKSSVSEFIPALNNPFGRESRYFVKISAVDSQGNISDPLEINNIIIDHYPPEIPDISIKNNKLIFKSSDDVFYKISSAGSINDFFVKYTKPVDLVTVPGISEKLNINFYSSDKSGNKSLITQYEYILDNSFPYINSDNRISKNNYSNSNFILKKSDFNPDFEYFYTISENLTPPTDPDEKSKIFQNDIVLECSEGEEKHFTIKILPVSKHNNNHGEISELHFYIDKIKPQLPVLSEIKEIYYSDNATINLKGAVRANTVYYSYSTDINILQSPFEGKTSASGAIVIPHTEKTREQFFLKTASIDKAGNRSESENVYSFVIDNRDYPENILQNINDENILSNTFTIKKPDDNYIYRYQISNNKSALNTVDYKSDIIDSELIFNSINDEEKFFFIAVKAFFDINDKKGSEERFIYIKIDRKKPEKPEIFISENNTIKLNGENVVLYSVFPEKTESISPEYKKYKKPFKLNKYIPPGRYNIKAYSRDKAGNISDASVDSFYISRNILYVSSQNGNDSYQGTYSRPLKNIDKAFDLYSEKKIDTIILLPGRYFLSEKLTVDNSLFIKGVKGKTFISSTSDSKNNLFNIINSSIFFKDLNIISSEYSSDFINSDKSTIVFDNTDIKVNCSNLLNLNKSSLIIEDSVFTNDTVFFSETVNCESGKINITESKFNISSSSGIKTFNLKNTYSQIKNTSFNLNSDETVFTISDNSIVKNTNIRLKIESGNYSYFYNLDKSKISIDNSFFTDSKDSEESIFLMSDNSVININDSNINLNSSVNSSLIKSQKGEYKLNKVLVLCDTKNNKKSLISSDNTVFNISGIEVNYINFINGGFISADNSIFEIYSSVINNKGSSNKIRMDFRGSGTVLLNNNNFNSDKKLLRRTTGISVLRN